jgi:hypothetical protein
VEPDARIDHLAHQFVFAHKDAALGVGRGVARMEKSPF